MTEKNKLTVGDKAPSGIALDVDDREVELSHYWAGGPILLTFLRHFG